ncbi:aminotransferase class IV [Streptomyces sp. SM11]|uniref:aminotransferase class IV n=1 Tax=Streptomyces sp. SM11 TaxID=565557 RepID=UPI000CD4BBD0|nr:aminotransferase class IV [Streptomyces sp. SM11]
MDTITALAMTNHGHFSTMRVEHSLVRGLSLHLARLQRDCRTVFDTELDVDEVRARLREAAAGGPDPITVRVTVFDPLLGLERPGAEAGPQLLVTTRPAAASAAPPLRLRTARHLREVPAVKHTGLFGALHERSLAQRDGFDDALFTDGSSAVAEGPTWNIGFFDGTRLVWPAADVLPGVTMALLRHHHSGPQCTEEVGVGRLSGMAAAFATNSSFGIRPIASIDDVEYDSGHAVLDALRKEYGDISPESL